MILLVWIQSNKYKKVKMKQVIFRIIATFFFLSIKKWNEKENYNNKIIGNGITYLDKK